MERTRRKTTKAAIVELSSDSDCSPKRKIEKSTSDDEYNLSENEYNTKKTAKAPVRKKRSNLKKKSNPVGEDEETEIKHILKENHVSKSQEKSLAGTSEASGKSEKCFEKQASEAPKKRKRAENPKESDDVQGPKKLKAAEGTSSKEKKTGSVLQMQWNESDYLADLEDIDRNIASAIIRLFNEDNTIPFIARYRKAQTGNMSPEKLRHVKESFELIKAIKHRAASITNSIQKLGKLTPDVHQSIKCAQDLEELDHIYAPFKPGTKRELAAKARALGLEPAAVAILNGMEMFDPGHCVNPKVKGLETVADVQKGIQHILADIISKDPDVMAMIRDFCKKPFISIASKKAPKRANTKDSKPVGKNATGADCAENVESKFSLYYDFRTSVKSIKSHQVLALNRGEKLKEISVRIVFPDYAEDKLWSFCSQKWLVKGREYPLRTKIVRESVQDAYSRLIQPLMTRQIRAELNKMAERDSIEVFATNLKSLLLAPPFKGHPVLAIDPGFKNGCKAALVSATGVLQEYTVMYLHNRAPRSTEMYDYWMRDMMQKHNCEVIAIGNGVACRETEQYIGDLIKRNIFKPLNVSYTIVNEDGVSIYSCSADADKDLPGLDPTIRSATSLARRLQDPLSELVKVEPRHLGVGMYQHDLPDKALTATLQEVVVECVSFVGVDLNTAPHCLLKQIAGLGPARAERILEWRENNGTFFNRDQLNEIKGIGKKIFEQCAGFVRINPDTIKPEDRWKLCPLDRTWIHPESYPFVKKFAAEHSLELEDLGSAQFRTRVQSVVASLGGEEGVANKYSVTKDVADLVIKGLLAPTNHDIRSEFEKPIFRQSVKSLSDVKIGSNLTGRVVNTVAFGAFVDIGVGQNGLIHSSDLKGRTLRIGDRVEVTVKQLELARKRISLVLNKVL